MIRFIENIGDYFSQHFFNEDFPKKVFDKSGYVTQKKDDDGVPVENHISVINSKVAPLREKYFRFKNEFLSIQRTKDRVKLTHEFHTELLKILDYKNGVKEYENPVFLNEKEVIPVRLQYHKGDRPYLFVMEMQAMIKEGDNDPQGIFEQVYLRDDWEKVFPGEWKDVQIKPDVINEALTELFILPEEERPQYVIMLAAPKIFLIHYEKWKYDSFLLFDIEELFTESQVSAIKDYLSLFYALLSKPQFISETESILHELEEDAHKSMYGVTQALKHSVIFAVESLANESIFYKLQLSKTHEEREEIENLMANDAFARELKDECLSFVYRLLFLFYAESREDLEILPVKDEVYQKGYSLEMLRDLEMVPLTTDSSRNGHFFSYSLWKLFTYLHKGQDKEDGFTMKPLDSPLFDNDEMKLLSGVQFRNFILQEIIVRLSLSERTKNKGRGRISYSNLGINQLGSVYESLLAYSGFFASEPLIEVKAADDTEGKEGTFLVPKRRRDDFNENEILKDPDHPERDVVIEKGRFVYRLNGRDRKKTASYYTPEVLTQTTVKYTLKGILDKLKERQANGEDCADEILKLKVLEPAMGAAAFQNEVINQLAVAYLEFKETEIVKKGGKRIVPGNYKDELQKVKAYIASHNVYGVDLNPTAVELGKLSLWLNCMHKDMETPFFAHRLGVGNAVVGAWLKVYRPKDFIVEFPTTGTQKQRTTPIPKDWWNKAPERIGWKNGKLDRKEDQIYHFLLPDDNMVPSAGIKMLKEELTDAEIRSFNAWKKEFKAPIRGDEYNRLKRICNVIDILLEEHYQQTAHISRETASHYNLYGQTEPIIDFRNYKEKERLAKLRNERSAPYFKLKTIMDYWCSLWFWDVRKVSDLPSRDEWYNEVENILGLDLEELSKLEVSAESITGFEHAIPEQQSLFGGPRQMALGSKAKPQDQKEKIRQLIADFSKDTTSLYENGRIKYIQVLSDSYKFFHNELEFIEVFKERYGFDIIAGNPPWVNIEMDESGILTEKRPEIEIRSFSAPEVKTITNDILSSDSKLLLIYLSEYVWAESTKTFMGVSQNYHLLIGQRNNLYKCILFESFYLINQYGMIGLIHPDGVYDDPKAQLLRQEIFRRLRYHFQFRNEFNLFIEVMHTRNFSLNIYSGSKSMVSFYSMSNLFSPTTIDASFTASRNCLCGGIKILNHKSNKMEWNIIPHPDRIVHISENDLIDMSEYYGDKNDYLSIPLPSIHSKQLLTALQKVLKYKSNVNSYDCFISDCLNETNAPKNGVIIKGCFQPGNADELVLSGPHIFVGNPFYRTFTCKSNKSCDYENVDVSTIDDNYLPQAGYLPNKSIKIDYLNQFAFFNGKRWIDNYKCTFNKMLDSVVERTLKSVILPPGVAHTNGLISIVFNEETQIVELSGLCSSLIVDFIIKSSGKGNIYDNTIRKLPLGISNKFKQKLYVRTLLLNSLSSYYSKLWESNWQDDYNVDSWSKTDCRLKQFKTISKKWTWETPLRNFFERRQALVEIDVITSLSFGLTFEELTLIYLAQFPVLQQYEDDTWYDQKGNIVFTCSKGLKGMGLDRKEWESITEQVSPMQRKLKQGDTYEFTITKSELYFGHKITYYSPFDKCDRVEDYKIAWAYFENIFENEKHN